MKKIFEGKKIIVLQRESWEFVERKSAKEAVAIIAVADGKLVLTEQYRQPVDARVIDLPAGLIEKHGPEETAKRELEEETGFTCDRIEFVMKAPTSPGITSEIVHYYRATNPKRTGKGGGVDNEDITVHTIAVTELESWLRQQKALIDGKVWTGIYFVT